MVSFNRVRVSLGGLLLVAATLKADSLLASTAAFPWYLAAPLVLAELLLAGFLFAGVTPLHTWWAATICFGCFAIVAGVKWGRGVADCGCFGAVATPPWVAFAIDLSALGALLITYRDRRIAQSTATTNGLSRLPMAIGVALIAVVGIKAVVSISSMQPTLAADDPTQWVGKRLPLLEDIDIGAELSSGAWIVILHRHGCAKCDELLSDAKPIVDHSIARIALVELLPPNATADKGRCADGMLIGRLYGREFIALPTPLVLQIVDGRVVFASDQFPSKGAELTVAHSRHSVQFGSLACVEKVK